MINSEHVFGTVRRERTKKGKKVILYGLTPGEYCRDCKDADQNFREFIFCLRIKEFLRETTEGCGEFKKLN